MRIRRAAIRASLLRENNEGVMKTHRVILLAILLALSGSLNACARRAVAPTPQASQPVREERLVIAYEGEDGKAALELLKVRAQVRTSVSQLGELVEEINGIRSGNGHNLIFYVNGTMAKTGAGNYVTKKGDKIEWKLIGPKKSQ
jgi:hypothetical protein